ncbi:MAG TPA: BtrH N-terminal domain-containing protein [Chitinophagales bacterium]|nr:BtrH N-terminal domain-containing protein [Chitinophagales bacterium]
MELNFEHIQAAHCENGVTTNLLRYAGMHQITEPLAFGIGAGIFYIHIPFLKISGGPAISFRTMPGQIFSRTCKALGVPVERKTFSSKEKAQQFLDDCLAKGQPAGCQVGVYHLTYFPKEFRFHFNAHNLVVYGKEGDTYKVSDPVMETVTTISAPDLERVRFAKGALAPNGQIYFPKEGRAITEAQISKAIIKGIKHASWFMTETPVPILGVAGIRFTAGRIKTWREALGPRRGGIYLAQLVRMGEEIGTGGAGFRFVYAAFLQQAHPFVKRDELLEISKQFTAIGDLWRASSVQASGIYKGRLTTQQDFNVMGDMLLNIADKEKEAFKALYKIKW